MSRRRFSRSAPTRWTPTPSLLAIPLLIAAAVILGGASGAGALPNMVLQLLSITLAWLTVLSRNRPELGRSEWMLVSIGAAFLVVGLVQLIPLPPSVWTALGGRDAIANQYHLLGVAPPALPVSLAAARTVAGLLVLSVAAGVFSLLYRADDAGLRAFAWAVAGMAAVSVGVGLAQLVGGEHSPLYFYSVTNRGQPVGFFANSNHLATLELMALPMIAALAARGAGSSAGAGSTDGGKDAGNVILLGALGVLVLMGAVTNGSLAALALLLPTAIGCFVLFRGGRSRKVALIAFGSVLVLVAAFVLLSLNSQFISGYASTSLGAGPTSRLAFVKGTLAAIAVYFPAGAGLGAFPLVYPPFEDANAVGAVFVNHAHNDYLEFVLDMGLPGVLLILAFLLWWVTRAVSIWRSREGGALARAATISTAIVLVHSVVDYPLRTSAVLAVFIGCCTIMARSSRPQPMPEAAANEDMAARHLSA